MHNPSYCPPELLILRVVSVITKYILSYWYILVSFNQLFCPLGCNKGQSNNTLGPSDFYIISSFHNSFGIHELIFYTVRRRHTRNTSEYNYDETCTLTDYRMLSNL